VHQSEGQPAQYLVAFLGPGEKIRVAAWCLPADIGGRNDVYTAVPVQAPATRSRALLRWLRRTSDLVVHPEGTIQRAGYWRAHYLAITDRRLILVGTDDVTTNAAPEGFQAYSLSDVTCDGVLEYGTQTFVSLSLSGRPREYVCPRDFEALLQALSSLGERRQTE
jgi:hypothetical protein